MTAKVQGPAVTGASPRLHPRPVYPSFWIILVHFIHLFVFHQGLVGALLVSLGSPFYAWTRQWADETATSDAFYFAVVLCTLHTTLYVSINLREW